MRYIIRHLDKVITELNFVTSRGAQISIPSTYIGEADSKRTAKKLLPIVRAIVRAVEKDDANSFGTLLLAAYEAFPGARFVAFFVLALSSAAFKCTALLLRTGYSPNCRFSIAWPSYAIEVEQAPPLVVLALQYLEPSDVHKQKDIISLAVEFCRMGAEYEQPVSFIFNGEKISCFPRVMMERSGLWGPVLAVLETDSLIAAVGEPQGERRRTPSRV